MKNYIYQTHRHLHSKTYSQSFTCCRLGARDQYIYLFCKLKILFGMNFGSAKLNTKKRRALSRQIHTLKRKIK